jgi:murein tripeptide amidase MpaA
MCDEIVRKYEESKTVYAHQETAIHTIEGRCMKLLTISSYIGITKEREEMLPGLFSKSLSRPFKFVKEKPCVFLTARVHPGETPGSHMLNGMIDLILEESEQGELLRNNFVFKIIPMLNPDGVYRGYYRLDTQGQNLNRHYANPDPVIFSLKW